MRSVLVGLRRHLLPVPWIVFQRLVARTAEKSRRVLGDLDEDHRAVHHFVVGELPKRAEPMPPELIADALALPLDEVVSIVDELEGRKIFLFRPGGREIEWAYPVTVAPTPHRILFSTGERINAA